MSNHPTMELTGIYKFIRWVAKGVFFLVYRVEIQGAENIPAEEPVILCPNHTSSWDPVILYVYIKRVIYFLTKEELYKNKLLGKILLRFGTIPVKRDGTDATAIKKSMRVLKAGKLLGVFSEGTSKKEDRRSLLEPKAGALLLALQTKTPIIPVAIYGQYKFRRKIIYRIGKPIYYDAYYGKKYGAEELVEISQETYMTCIKSMLDEIEGEASQCVK